LLNKVLSLAFGISGPFLGFSGRATIYQGRPGYVSHRELGTSRKNLVWRNPWDCPAVAV
jgi:hypothetical protein